MSTARAGMRGHAPKVTITPPKEQVVAPPTGTVFGKAPELVEPSQEVMRSIVEANMPTDEEIKYTKCWDLPAYRNYAPGEQLVDMFLEAAGEIPENSTLIDWGCGTGRASKKLYEQTDLDITMVDFCDNALDDDVRELATDNPRLRFVKHDLTEKSDFTSDYGFITDVMEHIPTEDVNKVLANILLSSNQCYFQICTQPDGFGGHPDLDDTLHLTVEGYFSWLQRFLDQAVIVLRSQEQKNNVIFYVCGWGEHLFRWSDAKLNISHEESCSHIIANSKLDIQPIKPHQEQDIEIMLVCGGPSALALKDDIIQKREAGMPLVTVNGSYKLVMDWGLKPSMYCMIDGREFNKRFISIPGYTDDCKYVISSHCHPSVFEDLPKDRTYMWTVALAPEEMKVVKEHYGKMYEDFFPCPGGSTVALRTLCLLRMLGFNKIHVYGLDSCNTDKNHAYEQTENDDGRIVEMTVGKGTPHEKIFPMETWHVYQFKEFFEMVPRVLNDCDLAIYGDGAIAYAINNAAELDDNFIEN